jgi:hypothetical protein
LNERNLAQKRAAKSGKDDDWKSFKKLRNKSNAILKKEKRSWESKRLDSCTSTSDTWRIVKNWLGWTNNIRKYQNIWLAKN